MRHATSLRSPLSPVQLCGHATPAQDAVGGLEEASFGGKRVPGRVAMPLVLRALRETLSRLVAEEPRDDVERRMEADVRQRFRFQGA